MGKFIDLTGQVFDWLTVIRRCDEERTGEPKWICRCACGNEVVVKGVNLRKGHTRSCGCKRLDLFRESRKLKNRYEIHGDHVLGYTTSGLEFIIDKDDLKTIEQFCWVRFGAKDRDYLVARMSNGKNIFLHRLITGAQDGEVVDHLNHNGCDNRKCNLRVVPQNKNMLNLCVRINNSSGVPGVSWSKDRNKWEAYISYEGKRHHLGRFVSFDDAVAARKAAEERYFGEYSYDNSIAAVPRIAV